MLPVLKEAGVVDSGGEGLVVVLKGMYDALTGKVTDFSITESKPSNEQTAPGAGKGAAVENVDIKFGYCTEFIIMLDKEFDEKTEADFKAFLTSIGDSIVCVALDDIVKVHVHTNHPGQAFEKALEYGQLTKMKVDNMREEHNQKVVAQSEILKLNRKKLSQLRILDLSQLHREVESQRFLRDLVLMKLLKAVRQ